MSALPRISHIEGVEVHVLDGTLPPDGDDVLAPEERERAARLRQSAQAQAYLCAHAGLRRLLAQRVGVSASQLRFGVGPFGKPRLLGAGAPHFSISYRPGCVAVAIAPRAVGIDVEQVRAGLDVDGIARRFFTAEEQAALPVAQRAEAFYALWTRKEALVKAAGVGIAGMGRAAAHGETARLADDEGRDRHYRIHPLPSIPGYALALAVDTEANP